MRQVEAELEARGIAVAVLSFDRNALVDSYVEQTKLPWPILMDHQRQLYHAYGMEHGHAWNLFGPRAIWAYTRLLLRGRRPRRGGRDLAQLGGDVLIDPEGIVRLHHVANGPADRPSVELLLAAQER